ncbi:MAG: glycosyltransferase [Acidocella sp.]|nr:glycosyltransferase [Acidocella sp.]
MNDSITILLSTFNGELYLEEQLTSFMDQSFANWRLLWRDDGSSDDSVAIMRNFARKIGEERCIELVDSGVHYGAASSFLRLLAHAASCAIVAFADQDDVWLPDKLSNAVRQVTAAGDGPVLYCARQFFVDHQLRGHRLSALHSGRGFPACLTQNIANGNTLVMNQSAVRLVVATKAPEATLHDWWSYIVISACDGQVIFDPEPQILYRLHNKNLIGRRQPLLKRAMAALRRGSYVFMTTMRRHAGALKGAELSLSPTARADLAMVTTALSGNFSSRIQALHCLRLRRESWLENILFSYWFIKG